MTAMPHPKVMTIQPEFSAFDLASSTAATTPSPSRIRIPVPMISDGTMPKCGICICTTTAASALNAGLPPELKL